MKKLLFIISCLSVVNSSVAQSLLDNFDDYIVGDYLCPQSNNLWSTWDNNPGGPKDVYVTDEFSYSGPNSIKFASGDSSDIVLPFGNVNTGNWVLSFMMRIESGYGAYFNLLHKFANNESNWAFHSYFSHTGDGSFAAGPTNAIGYTFSHPTGEWFKVKVVINVDNNAAILSINDHSTDEIAWAWCVGSDHSGNNFPFDSTIAALNLVTTAPEGEEALFYIDDLSFQTTNIGIEELDGSIKLYPNPVSDRLVIEAESVGATCEIVSVLGAQIYKETLPSNHELVDCSTWIPGVYFLQITNQSGSVQRTKFIVE